MEANTGNNAAVREWILNYAGYDAHEKSDVEDFVSIHPEWASVFQTAGQWDRMFSAAAELSNPDKDEERLPYIVAATRGPWPSKSHALREFVSRGLRRCERNPQLSAHILELEERKDKLEAETNVFDHFNAVTGIDLQSSSAFSAEGTIETLNNRSRIFTPLAQIFGSKLARIFALTAGVYIILFAASTFRQSPAERMAHLSPRDYSWTELGVTSRGSAEWERAMVSRYNEALDLARSSSVSFLGLFPTYDMTKLQRARRVLRAAILSQSQREVVPAEAYRTLAKIHFLLGEQIESLDALRRALILEGAGPQYK